MPKKDKHIATDKIRGRVEQMAAFGISRQEIAEDLGISLSTLLEYYTGELKRGKVKIVTAVASKLVQKALKQDNLDAQKYFLSRIGGWREGVDNFNHAVPTVIRDDIPDDDGSHDASEPKG